MGRLHDLIGSRGTIDMGGTLTAIVGEVLCTHRR
ncbi:unnamed protein product [Brassica rapa subsp. narinosa]